MSDHFYAMYHAQYHSKVPVIVIFTKFDGLVISAFTELVDRGDSWENADEGSIDHAKQTLAKNFEARLDATKTCPAARVRLDGG